MLTGGTDLSSITSRYSSHALDAGARPGFGHFSRPESVDTPSVVAGFATPESVDTPPVVAEDLAAP
jgi:hypothetical protein